MLASPFMSLLPQSLEHTVPVLHLFGGPFVTLGERRVDIPEGSKRLLVFCALHRGGVDRRYAAGLLWPDVTDSRAAGNLRSALWRLRRADIQLMYAGKYTLSLRDDVLLDVEFVTSWATRLIDGSASCDDLSLIPWSIEKHVLLPGWYEDWVLSERERVTQRLLRGLEVQSRQLLQQGRPAEAVEAAMVATRADPLRESAQQALVEAYLAEGNHAEAHRRFKIFRDLLGHELGIEPSPQLSALVSGQFNRPIEKHSYLHGMSSVENTRHGQANSGRLDRL